MLTVYRDNGDSVTPIKTCPTQEAIQLCRKLSEIAKRNGTRAYYYTGSLVVLTPAR